VKVVAVGRHRKGNGGAARGPHMENMGRLGEKRNGRAEETMESLIYSNNFQMSSNCFDQKVDLSSSKNFK
jgi:hypothetical protein